MLFIPATLTFPAGLGRAVSTNGITDDMIGTAKGGGARATAATTIEDPERTEIGLIESTTDPETTAEVVGTEGITTIATETDAIEVGPVHQNGSDNGRSARGRGGGSFISPRSASSPTPN